MRATARRELLDYLHDEGCARRGAAPGGGGGPARAAAGRAPARRRRDLQPARDRRGVGPRARAPRRVPPGARPRGPRPRREVLGEADLETAKDAAALADAGFPLEDTLEVTRVLGRGMVALRRGAARAVRPDASSSPATRELELARRLAERGRASCCRSRAACSTTSSSCTCASCCATTSSASPSAPRARSPTRRRRRSRSPTSSASPSWGRPSTSRSSAGSRAGSSKLAGDVVEPPVRVVKQIGDAVMLVSPDAAADRSRPASTLVERAEAEDDFPPLRAGVSYGPAVNRWGDWFGSTVNVASRLTARARPERRARHRGGQGARGRGHASRGRRRARRSSRASTSRSRPTARRAGAKRD